VWPELEDVVIWSRTREHAERLAAETDTRAVELDEAAWSEVVLTVTSSPTPVLRGRDVRKNALVLAVGATGVELRELDDELMRSAFVVGESRDAAERESGDVKLSGVWVRAEIGQLLAGQRCDLVPRGGRVVSKSVGMAIEDLTAARLVWEARGGC
jgi:thiomorpholine-carboxylate dehydrogenase